MEKSKNELVTVVITDGELGNLQESVTFFREYLNEEKYQSTKKKISMLFDNYKMSKNVGVAYELQ